MVLSPADIDAIRAEVAHEPETSPARRLLAHLDSVKAEKDAAARVALLTKLIDDDGFSPIEAERAIKAYFDDGVKPELDYNAQCPVCNGKGRDPLSFRVGCGRCNGSGTILTYKKVPPESRYERDVDV